MPAGELRQRVAFEKQAEVASSFGIEAGDWTEQFQVWCRVRPLRGTEPVIAQRLVGVQPIVLTVRSSSDTRLIDASWRARHVHSGALYNIRAVTPDERKAYIDLLTESGVAQ